MFWEIIVRYWSPWTLGGVAGMTSPWGPTLALLKFVALHELAHIANSIPGTENHGPEFWRTFKMLLLEAKDNGLCTELTTESGTITYCNGLKMTNSNLTLDKVRV
jgi:hypothetical protein